MSYKRLEIYQKLDRLNDIVDSLELQEAKASTEERKKISKLKNSLIKQMHKLDEEIQRIRA